MKEEKICSFTQPGYRLQLLKITETTVNGYYQIRENRRIKATFTTLDTAIKKFYALQGSKILQKDIFNIDNNELNKKEISCIYEHLKHYELDILTDKKCNINNISYNEAIILMNKLYKISKNQNSPADKGMPGESIQGTYKAPKNGG